MCLCSCLNVGMEPGCLLYIKGKKRGGSILPEGFSFQRRFRKGHLDRGRESRTNSPKEMVFQNFELLFDYYFNPGGWYCASVL